MDLRRGEDGTGRRRPARSPHERTVLELLRAAGPRTRAGLREASGLSQPTVLEIVRRLVSEQLVVDVGVGREGKRGPSARRFDLDAHAGLACAAAVGADRVTLAVADLRGRVIARSALDRAAEDPPGRIAAGLVDLVRGAGLDLERLAATVIGTHGLIDPATGDLGFAWDLPAWQNAMIGPLRELLPGDVWLERDVLLAAETERRALTPVLETLGVLWLDTGVGYAGFLGGIPVTGVHGAAGQVGYLPTPGAPTPVLPAQHSAGAAYDGGLQSRIGRAALEDLARELGEGTPTDPASALSRPGSLQEAYADRVALGIAAVAAVLDPGTVVLGGRIGRAGGEELAAAVEERVCSRVPIPVTVRAGQHGAEAVLEGAVTVAAADARAVLWH